ncbi:DUF3794 and LysM peptidoglycan-binding domain-containing protein [Alkaliphilus hydrothermalis]|uniref:LysM domain-containing protein n=1 Tax=Alkaliphilus hydrothermalis TaxID=1482730 RepID=A0ABS2NQ00_9FIRM|nr:SPOCS domain-containing protein [Alkaliphilus hydrothermalis]MBM7615029.1 hypothetical protein [Alkaliphilus hydrothermalis]
MPVELIKDVFLADQVVGQDTAQAIIEGDILVPDIKPDITRVISVDGVIQVTKKEIVENKINTEGVIKFKILYVSDRGEEPLYSIDSSTSFKQAIPVEGINSKMKADVQGEIEHIDFTINNERKIGVKAVVNLDGIAVESTQQELTKEVGGLGDLQVLKENLQFTDIVGEGVSETLVKDTFEIDEDLPGVKEILKWNARAIERETKITDGKVIVGGTMLVELLYIGEDEENTLNILKKEVPFTHFAELRDIFSDMKYKLKLNVDDVFTEIKENIQGERKIIEVEAIAKVAVKVMDTHSRELIVDAYSPSQKLKVLKNEVSFKENVGMNRAHMMLRETLDIPSNQPEIKRMFSVQVKPVLTDYTLVEDKTIIEGVLETTVIYVSEEDLQPLYSFMQEVPFRHYVDIDGLKEDMEAGVDLSIEEVDYSLINNSQVDVKVNIAATCEAFAKRTIEVVNNIEELGEALDTSKKPSLTIYFLQPGDTLWQVAKRYHTTVKQILESNNLSNVEDIKVGDYIIIEKVHQFKF